MKWKVWQPGNSAYPNDLIINNIEYNRGYWIKTKQPNLTLSIQGTYSKDDSIKFFTGWNFVGIQAGLPSESKRSDIEAMFRDHVQGEKPDVDLIYGVDENQSYQRWDFTIDRLNGDYNADGKVDSLDGQFQNGL